MCVANQAVTPVWHSTNEGSRLFASLAHQHTIWHAQDAHARQAGHQRGQPSADRVLRPVHATQIQNFEPRQRPDRLQVLDAQDLNDQRALHLLALAADPGVAPMRSNTGPGKLSQLSHSLESCKKSNARHLENASVQSDVVSKLFWSACNVWEVDSSSASTERYRNHQGSAGIRLTVGIRLAVGIVGSNLQPYQAGAWSHRLHRHQQ
jgi:hypothetical protein